MPGLGSDLHPAPWPGEKTEITQRVISTRSLCKYTIFQATAGRVAHVSEEAGLGPSPGLPELLCSSAFQCFLLKKALQHGLIWDPQPIFSTGQICPGRLLCFRHAVWGSVLPKSRTIQGSCHILALAAVQCPQSLVGIWEMGDTPPLNSAGCLLSFIPCA